MSDTSGNPAIAISIAPDNEDTTNLQALMRRSSPLVRSPAPPSPLLAPVPATTPSPLRSGTASPLRLTRPRSNPRNRTPMRYESPLNANAFRIDEEPRPTRTTEGQRITIRPMAGSAVGANVPTAGRTREDRSVAVVKSRKQGPSQRKIRRWNNDNFVNLASEISSGKKGRAAAAVLLKGQADAPKYRSIYNPEEHKSETMSRFMKDDKLHQLRDKFFAGELQEQPTLSRDHKLVSSKPLTPEDMMNRIDDRLRRVVVKACANSFPASQVVDNLETFLVRAYAGRKDDDKLSRETWNVIVLLEPPTVTVTERKHSDDDNDDNNNHMVTTCKFLFDAESSAGGFYRLLLHGLCQFHGLQATSSTVDVVMIENHKQARMLTATGTLSGPKVRLVEQVMKRHEALTEKTASVVPVPVSLEAVTNKMTSLTVSS